MTKCDGKTHKRVRREGDEYYCSHCGKRWPVNDQNPPVCKTGDDWLREIRTTIHSNDRERVSDYVE